jgi:hypothetical protein
MAVFVLHPGGATMLVEASGHDQAREVAGHYLGYARKPYLWKAPTDDRPDPMGTIRLATPDDEKAWKSQGRKVLKASEVLKRDPTESNPPRRQKAAR